MSEERLYQVALTMIPGVGCVLIKQLLSLFGSAKEIFEQPYKHLIRVPRVTDSIAKYIINKTGFKDAEDELTIASPHCKLLFITDKEYPFRLKHIPDSPALLYYKGNTNLNERKIISIVGTRKCTSYGKQITEEIIKGLCKHNPIIVSGLAYGIDIEAHKKALEYGLETIGVMASGIEHLYPSEHKPISLKMIEHGGILTEEKYKTLPDRHRFPNRNRIIAGMTDITIVIEAAARGGALITAELANDYNREVMAVPAQVNHKYSEGCNRLIKKNKAHIYTGPSDIEELLNWDTQVEEKQKPLNLNSEEEKVYNTLLQHNEQSIDVLSMSTGIRLNKIATILLTMELNQVIKVLPGNRYRLI